MFPFLNVFGPQIPSCGQMTAISYNDKNAENAMELETDGRPEHKKPFSVYAT
jgi:hypothetical protein